MVIWAAPWVSCGNICRLQSYFLVKLLCIHPVHIAFCKVVVGGRRWVAQTSLENTGWIDKGCRFVFFPQNTLLQQPNQAGWGKLGRPWGTARTTTEPQLHQSYCRRCFQGTQKPTCPVSCSQLLSANTHLPSTVCVLPNCSALQLLWVPVSSVSNCPARCSVVFSSCCVYPIIQLQWTCTF